MERLKGICAVPAGRGGRDLHSSMERLKGKILVFPQDCSLKFTFQYGEIKSISDGSPTVLQVAIYIPVWRD